MNTDFNISGKVVDVVKKRIFNGNIKISDGIIVSISETSDDFGQFILPGLIDAHIHIESSMLIPSEFARLAVVHGTVGTVSDPHEIANVLGIDGIKFMIENGRKVPFYFNFGAPSCVPATPFETSGAKINANEVKQLLSMDNIGYLSEMMNFPGVINGDPEVMAKIAAAKSFGKPVDGHAPGLSGDALIRYVNAGISTDHECFTIDEALEKINLGMKILIREGSAAKNFDVLIGLIKQYSDKIMLCSDDKHPDDLVEGHINLLIKRAMKKGFDFIDIVRACTCNPVKHYNLTAGLLQPGDPADFIVIDNPDHFNIMETYVKEKKVAANGRSLIKNVSSEIINSFRAQEIKTEDIKVRAGNGLLKVQKALDGQLITKMLLAEPLIENGFVVGGKENDVLKMLVLNRYQKAKPVVSFVSGFGLKKGAIASTVAHDSHNIIAVGVDDNSLIRVVNLLISGKGGIVATDGSVDKILPLPVGGIMTNEDGYRVAKEYHQLDKFAKELGSRLSAPFMTLSFMALLVIPELKTGDKGLFDGVNFKLTELFDQKDLLFP